MTEVPISAWLLLWRCQQQRGEELSPRGSHRGSDYKLEQIFKRICHLDIDLSDPKRIALFFGGEAETSLPSFLLHN